MIAILYLLALSAAAQTPASSLFTVLPKSDGSATGCLNFRELAASGLNYGCLKAPSDIYANRTVTLPNYTTTLIGDQNYAYGSNFIINGTRANGTEAAPTDVIAGNGLFQFLGKARSGGVATNAAALNFYVGTASPLTTYATVELSNAGTFATAYALEVGKFYSTNTPDIGMSIFRFGTLYAGAGDFSGNVQGATATFNTLGAVDASWMRTQNVEIMDINGGPAKWRWKGYANLVDKYLWLENPDGVEYLRFDLVRGFTNIKQGVLGAHWYPAVDDTYNLGASSLRWKDIRGTTATIGNLTVTGTCTGCSTVTSSAPLGEVKITDYGATSNCTTPTTVRTALASALAALPTDASGKKSGIVTFPAGCYGWDIANGSLLLDRAGATPIGDVWLVGAGAGSEFAAVGAGTEIRAIGSAPASATAMVEFRKVLGGGVRNIQLNAAGVANTRILKVRETRFAHFENLQGRRWTSGPGLEFATESGASAGSCHNNFIGLNLGDVKDTDQASGILLDGQIAGYSACSNKFTHGIAIYSKSGSSTYGIKFRYADNNTFDRFNVWASDCTAYPCETNGGSGRTTGTNPAITFEQWPSDRTFPKENRFDGTPVTGSGYLVTGASGTTGNVVNHTVDDCGGLLVGCFPVSIRNVRGSTSFGAYMSRAAFPHNDATQATYTLDQTNGNFTNGGRLNFARQDRTWASIFADSASGGGLDFAVNNSATCTLFASVGSRSVHAATALSNIFVSGGTATASTATAHGCAAGDRIRVSEGQVSGLNGDFTVTNAPSSTQLQWATSAANGTYNNDGLTVEVAPIPYWQIAQGGNFRPASDALAAIGSASLKPSAVWSRAFNSYTASSLGTQTHSLTADAAVNLNLDVWGGSGADPTPGINFRRGSGSLGFPVSASVNDRMGRFAFWGYTPAGFAVGAVIESYVTGTNFSNAISGDLRFRTINLGSSNTALQLLSSGAASFISTVDAVTFNATGNPAYRVGGTTVIDSSRNATFNVLTVTSCTGCGGGGANTMTTDTTQTVTGTKTWQSNLVGTSSILTVASHLAPATSGIWDIGSSIFPIRWRTAYLTNIDMSGTFVGAGGVTVIDSSRNGFFNTITVGSCTGCGGGGANTMTTDTTQTVTGTKTWQSNLVGTSSILTVASHLSPSSSNTWDLGSNLIPIRWRTGYLVNLDLSGNIIAPSGNFGTNTTLSCTTGQAIKTITISAGIVTGVTCGAP